MSGIYLKLYLPMTVPNALTNRLKSVRVSAHLGAADRIGLNVILLLYHRVYTNATKILMINDKLKYI